MPLAQVALTNTQFQTLVAAVGTHSGSVHIEQLRDGYARIVLIGSEGEAIEEQLLFPV